MDQLGQLRSMTTIVADTGDISAIQHSTPTDATTNPTLILNAAQKPQYKYLIEKTIHDVNQLNLGKKEKYKALIDHLVVHFGCEILKIIPGRVSTEVDAHLSFDTQASIEKAHHLIHLYNKAGIKKERILIKLATTWEGIRAAEQLEKEGIHCNMTLMFSLPQAVACAEAKATLVSPFVGRIYDWYKKNEGKEYAGPTDPGVLSVSQVYAYFKKFGYKTQVMGASFRNKGQILELAGCDLLTISPTLLNELKTSQEHVERKLSAEKAQQSTIEKMSLNESSFRFLFNENPMAVDKLAEGIRLFAQDFIKLQNYILKEFASFLE